MLSAVRRMPLRVHVGELGVDVGVLGQDLAVPVAHPDVALAVLGVDERVGRPPLHQGHQLGGEQVALAVDPIGAPTATAPTARGGRDRPVREPQHRHRRPRGHQEVSPSRRFVVTTHRSSPRFASLDSVSDPIERRPTRTMLGQAQDYRGLFGS